MSTNELYKLGTAFFSFHEEIQSQFGNSTDHLELANYFLEWFCLLMLCLDCAPTWYDISTVRNYEVCGGDQYLQWRGRGYKTILDVLMVITHLAIHAKILF